MPFVETGKTNGDICYRKNWKNAIGDEQIKKIANGNGNRI